MILFPKQKPKTKAQNYQEKLKLSQLSRPKSDLQTITIKAKVKNASFRVKNEPKLSKKKKNLKLSQLSPKIRLANHNHLR